MIPVLMSMLKLLHVNETLKLLEPEAWTTQLQNGPHSLNLD